MAGYHSGMLFFKRILKYEPEVVARQELRLAERHKVESRTPIKASLHVRGHDYAITLLNMSIGGAGAQIAGPFDLNPGELCAVRFELGGNTLELNGTVAHEVSDPMRSKLGITFKFADFSEKKAYLQLLEPVAIGASLKPDAAPASRPKEQGLLTHQYSGPNDTRLTVWRQYVGQAVHGFEFRLANHFLRNSSTPGVLEVFASDDPAHEHKQGYDVPALKRVDTEAAEIRQLFLWIVPHMNPAVPDDIRDYLAEFRH